MRSADVVIAGAGLAAQRCCEALRRLGYDGSLLLIGDEPCAPYDRPPLSKHVLTGARDTETLAFRPAQWYLDHEVDLLLGVSACGLDPSRRTLLLSDSHAVRFGKLVIATGSRPRRLPTLPLGDRVRELRTLQDAKALRAALVRGGRLLIVGAGLVGMEVASSARALGIDVALIEAAATPLARALPPQLGRWLAGLQLRGGVDVRLGTTVRAAARRKADVRLDLSDGSRLCAHAVLVATGTTPASEWLAGSPLGSGAVAVDAGGRSSLGDIYAAGDVACAEDPLTGERRPAQHWEAAARGGADVARSIVGLAPAPSPPAMFWSDQHGRRVHVIGNAPAACTVEVEADPDGGGFTAWLHDRGVLRGAVLVDRPGCLAQARARVSAARPGVKEARIAA